MSTNKLRSRILNGYRTIYLPDHPKAMTSDNWKGFVYEHTVIVENKIGRSIAEDEVVHHLDNNPINNKYENLMVLTRGQHLQLHRWLDKVKPFIKNTEFFHDRQSTDQAKQPDYCKICDNILQTGQDLYCSPECNYKQRTLDGEIKRGKSKPSKEQLQEDMNTLPWTEIGNKYGVSGNGAKKWAKGYELDIDSKPHIVINKNSNPSPRKIYNSPEEKQKAKNERNRIKYSNMTDEEKRIKKFGIKTI